MKVKTRNSKAKKAKMTGFRTRQKTPSGRKKEKAKKPKERPSAEAIAALAEWGTDLKEGEELPRPGELDYWVWFPGVGFGDVKLLAMIGAVLGPAGVLQTILLASLAGLLLGLGWALVTRRMAALEERFPAVAEG